jgi:hypothetical protein
MSLSEVSLQFRVTTDSGFGKINVFYTDSYNWNEDTPFNELPSSSAQVGELSGDFENGKDYSIVLDKSRLVNDRFTLIFKQTVGGVEDDFAFYSSESESGFQPRLIISLVNESSNNAEPNDNQEPSESIYDNVDIDNAIPLPILKAFPSAQGHGAEIITGGENGAIFYVESFENTDAGYYDAENRVYRGTFKYAMQHPNPGYIIFRTGGVIRAFNEDDYSFNGGGNKTILGASAPFPGVVFYGHRFRLSNSSNWVLRGMTFLGGDNLVKARHDAFVAVDVTELILSDNNFGWGADEIYSIARGDNFIVQRNVSIEGYPGHNVGSIFTTNTKVKGKNKAASIHDNAYIHNTHRFPNVQGLETDVFDIVNQFAFNMGSRLSSHKFQININQINGYYKAGPRTNSRPNFKWNADNEGSNLWEPAPKIFTVGNIVTNYNTDPNYDNRNLWNQHISANGFLKNDPLPDYFFVDQMHTLGTDITIKTAIESYEFNILEKNIGSRYYMDSNGEKKK